MKPEQYRMKHSDRARTAASFIVAVCAAILATSEYRGNEEDLRIAAEAEAQRDQIMAVEAQADLRRKLELQAAERQRHQDVADVQDAATDALYIATQRAETERQQLEAEHATCRKRLQSAQRMAVRGDLDGGRVDH